MSEKIKVNVERRLTAAGAEDVTYIELRARPKADGLPFGIVVRYDAEEDDEPSLDTGFPDVVRLWVPSRWANDVADALAEAVRQARLVARRR